MTKCDDCEAVLVEVNGINSLCANGHVRDSRFSDFTEDNGWKEARS